MNSLDRQIKQIELKKMNLKTNVARGIWRYTNTGIFGIFKKKERKHGKKERKEKKEKERKEKKILNVRFLKRKSVLFFSLFRTVFSFKFFSFLFFFIN